MRTGHVCEGSDGEGRLAVAWTAQLAIELLCSQLTTTVLSLDASPCSTALRSEVVLGAPFATPTPAGSHPLQI